jgi:hypothetical protein
MVKKKNLNINNLSSYQSLLIPLLLATAFVILLISLNPTGIYNLKSHPLITPILSPKPIRPTLAISPPLTPIPWQTYKNDKYGFKFQYPVIWNLHETKNEISLCDIHSAACIFIYFRKPGTDSDVGQPYTFNNLKALRYDFTSDIEGVTTGPVIKVLTQKPIYIVTYNYLESEQILSTFKFTQ